MDRLSVFSKKFGFAVPVTNVGSSIRNNINLSMSEWTDGGWNNYSYSWLNEGWNNYSYDWQNEGWNNYSYSWQNEGWNNYSYSWQNGGWNNYSDSYSDSSSSYDGGK